MKVFVFLACLSVALAFSPKRLGGKNLIVGGVEAPIGSRPYHVAVQRNMDAISQYCAGTLVHPEWVVSAAHCAGDKVYVGLGFHNLYEDGSQTLTGTWIVHEQFDDYTYDNDVALIKLDAPAVFSDTVESINIASAGSTIQPDESLLVSGWGTTSSGGTLADELRQVVVAGVKWDTCNDQYKAGNAKITSNQICAAAAGKDACQGDSGGPLVSNFNENMHQKGVLLEGIVSWGYGCADPKYPGVYTAVTNYCSWIAEKTNSAVTC